MLTIISPAKTLDYESNNPDLSTTEIRFPKEASQLVSKLKKLSADKLSELMSISRQLAKLNVERFQKWDWPYPTGESRAALFAFKGDVYTGLDASSLPLSDIEYSQESVRILSGLYGLLRPLDEILPYRLEMGTKMSTSKGKNLYDFWGDKITLLLKKELSNEGSGVLVNLASQEYFKVLNKKKLGVRIVTPVFKDYTNGSYKLISFFAKKARGKMTRFIVENRITNPDDLKAFDTDGYHFNNELSKEDQFVFTRIQGT
jgi:uncharacterized protein